MLKGFLISPSLHPSASVTLSASFAAEYTERSKRKQEKSPYRWGIRAPGYDS
jgi:hypothetical protein